MYYISVLLNFPFLVTASVFLPNSTSFSIIALPALPFAPITTCSSLFIFFTVNTVHLNKCVIIHIWVTKFIRVVNSVHLMNNSVSPIKRSKEWEAKFSKIGDFALDLFLKDGENMSMRDLAKKMDIAVGGLYRYVQDKRDLFFHCQNQY